MAKDFWCTATEPVVTTKYGRLRGFRLGDIYHFYGIKYADAKRFQMPKEVEPWDGIKDALSYGYIAPLMEQESPQGDLTVPHRFWPKSEDCQYLNIWTPSLDQGAKKAVMVWIHGGAFSTGSSLEMVAYDGNNLAEYEDVCQVTRFDDMESCLEYFYSNKKSTNKLNQKASSLIRSVTSQIDKLHLKEQRLKEDLLKAENSEELRLYGELLTASIHQIEPGAKNATVLNYYDGSEITIPLDPRFSPSKNAQNYFKKYGKAKTAVKEKQIQLDSVGSELAYLGSVLSYLENAEEIDDIDALRKELEEGGYVRRRKIPGGFKEKKYQAKPYKYELPGGAQVLVGRNNKENDFLTFKLSSSKDIWLHTKDIPGSHVILRGLDKAAHEPDEKTIYAAASIAAYYSKARGSENVPVDYVPIKYVKKPQGAKPGMVIFTNNRTVWVNPKLPQ